MGSMARMMLSSRFAVSFSLISAAACRRYVVCSLAMVSISVSWDTGFGIA